MKGEKNMKKHTLGVILFQIFILVQSCEDRLESKDL